MKQTNVQILHNIVRYPILIVSVPIQLVALALKDFADGLNAISLWWGNFLIKKLLSR